MHVLTKVLYQIVPPLKRERSVVSYQFNAYLNKEELCF